MFKQTALSSLDSYKLGHADQYPDGITKVYSNFTPRSDNHFNVPKEYKDGKIVWFGLQLFLMELKAIWDETFFSRSVKEFRSEASELFAPFCGPNGFDVSRLDALWDLGYLPLEIKSLPEGSVVPIGVPVLTITNTVDEFAWLPNFLETWMSSELWKASTSATMSRVYRKILNKYSALTGGFDGFIQWQGHDFSVRGMSGISDAAKSGAGHLLSFTGTDNIPAVKLINDCYRGKETFVGGSVPASEHSVMCAGGKESEIDTFRRLLKTYPSGVVSIVSDTWDFWNVITNTAKELKEEILARVPDQFGLAKTVFRPDSGDPVEIICGVDIKEILDDNIDDAKLNAQYYIVDRVVSETPHGECGENSPQEIFKYKDKYYLAKVEIEWNRFDKQYYYEDGSRLYSFEEIELTPSQKGAVDCLAEIFGTTTNEKGYKTLNPRVGLIYGDSITPQRAEAILQRLMKKGYASDNIVFGIGSYTFQYQTRDTFGFAMKATYVEINGYGQAIFKDPITDNGTKKSAKGLLQVTVDIDTGEYILVDNASKSDEECGELKTVFLNGEIIKFDTITNIRDRLLKSNK